MLSNVYCKEVEELYAIPILQQTAFWSVVKTSLGENTIAINFKSRKSDLLIGNDDSSIIQSDLLIILKQISRNHSVAYVPYGLEPDDELFRASELNSQGYHLS